MEKANAIDVKLYNSSLDGDLDGVEDALRQGGRVAIRNPEGYTPLLAAAAGGNLDICGLLLAHGSDVNEVGLKTKSTTLHLAALRGQKAVVEAFLSWGATADLQDHTGTTPLFSACQEGHLACVLILLKAGPSMYLGTVEHGGRLPIHVAAQRNRVEIVRTLVDHGCSPNVVSCFDNTLSTLISSSLLSAKQCGRDHTTHVCSIVRS